MREQSSGYVILFFIIGCKWRKTCMQAEEKKVTKLQIGVKKRVEDCDVRSKKGLWGGD